MNISELVNAFARKTYITLVWKLRAAEGKEKENKNLRWRLFILQNSSNLLHLLKIQKVQLHLHFLSLSSQIAEGAPHLRQGKTEGWTVTAERTQCTNKMEKRIGKIYLCIHAYYARACVRVCVRNQNTKRQENLRRAQWRILSPENIRRTSRWSEGRVKGPVAGFPCRRWARVMQVKYVSATCQDAVRWERGGRGRGR